MHNTELATWVGSIAMVVTGIAIIITLWFLYQQNKSLKRSVESSTYQDLMQNETAWHRLMVENPELDQIIYKEEKEKNIAEAKAYWTCMVILAFMENICDQRKRFGLIGDEAWPSWEDYIKDDLKKFSYLRHVLSRNKGMFLELEKLVGI